MACRSTDCLSASHRLALGSLLLQQHMCRSASQHRLLLRVRIRHRHLHCRQFRPFLTDSGGSGFNLQSQLVKHEEYIPRWTTSKTPIQARHGHSSSTVSHRDHGLPVLVPHLCDGTGGTDRLYDIKLYIRLVSCSRNASQLLHQPSHVHSEGPDHCSQ